jgi:hypothetical protein
VDRFDDEVLRCLSGSFPKFSLTTWGKEGTLKEGRREEWLSAVFSQSTESETWSQRR